MKRSTLAVAILAAAMSTTPASSQSSGQSSQAWTRCQRSDGSPLDIAITSCTSIIEAAGETPQRRADALFHRGYAQKQNRDYEKAIADYSLAITLNPGNPEYFVQRGVAHKNMGAFDAAFADYATALRLDADNVNALDARCYANVLMNQLQKALTDCNRSLQLSKTSYTLDSRGLVYARLGRFDDAIRDYDAALALDPKLAASLYGRGFARLKKGDTAKGNADIAAAKAITPDIAETLRAYGLK
jgi:tetratricopeptide (TPR) repeat protein